MLKSAKSSPDKFLKLREKNGPPKVVYFSWLETYWFKECAREYTASRKPLKSDLWEIYDSCIDECTKRFDGAHHDEYIRYRLDALVSERCWPHVKFPAIDPDPLYTRIFDEYFRIQNGIRIAAAEMKLDQSKKLRELRKEYRLKLREERKAERRQKNPDTPMNSDSSDESGDSDGNSRKLWIPLDQKAISNRIIDKAEINAITDEEIMDAFGEDLEDVLEMIERALPIDCDIDIETETDTDPGTDSGSHSNVDSEASDSTEYYTSREDWEDRGDFSAKQNADVEPYINSGSEASGDNGDGEHSEGDEKCDDGKSKNTKEDKNAFEDWNIVELPERSSPSDESSTNRGMIQNKKRDIEFPDWSMMEVPKRAFPFGPDVDNSDADSEASEATVNPLSQHNAESAYVDSIIEI